MTRNVLAAVLICGAAAALEGLFAGRGVRARLQQLRQPRHSPPFGLWVGIGFVYYVICGILLIRLFGLSRSPLRTAAVGALLLLLLGNAFWNLTFFRLRNLPASVAVVRAYAAVALALEVFLCRLDPPSAWVFVPYLVYLVYAIWWMRSLRRLNP